MTNRAADNEIARQVRALAAEHNVAYAEGPHDALAHKITALAGDDVQLDDIELLILALERAAVITGREATRLQTAYLRLALP